MQGAAFSGGETECIEMAVKQFKFTVDGLKRLEEELDRLKTVTRAEVSEKIKVARSFGDLSENSEYDEAKNEQARVEARIAELEMMVKNAVIIEEDASGANKIGFGSKVKLRDIEMDEELDIVLVGSAEADPMNGAISDESPIGAALIGKKVGATVVAETPSGELKFKVLEVSK